MARQFRKSVLKVGTYHSPDGRVDVTPERLNHWAETFRRMKQAKQVVPVGWDHANTEDGIKPMSAAAYKRSARDTVGRLANFTVNGDSAELTIEVTDPKAAERAERNEVFVSPIILDKWRDGAANQYTDCITHVDFVNHPVDHSQGQFEPVEQGTIACALRMGLSGVYRMSAIRLGSDDPADGFYTTPGGQVRPITVGGSDYLDDDHKAAKGKIKSKKAGKKKRKKMSMVRMGGPEDEFEDDDDDYEDDDTDFIEDDGEDDSVDLPPAMPQTPITPPVRDLTSDAPARLPEVVKALSKFNIIVSPDTDETNLLAHLHQALLTAEAHKKNAAIAGDEPEDTNADGPQKIDGATPTVEQPPMAMSLDKNNVAYRYAERTHQKTVADRIENLLKTGRCTPEEAGKLKANVKMVRLSLDGEGNPVPGKLEDWLECREGVPAGSCWNSETKTRMSRVAVVDPPAAMRGEMTSEEVSDAANFYLRRGKSTVAAN